jgi:hypothetical protein
MLAAWSQIRAAPTQERPLPGATVADLVKDEAALLPIASRLALAAVNFCEPQDRVSLFGFSVHDLAQYGGPYRADAAKLFVRPDLPAVLAVSDPAVQGSGLHPGDALVALDGLAVPPLASPDDYRRPDAIADRIERIAPHGRLMIDVQRHQQRIRVWLTARTGCRSRFQVTTSSELQAQANGERVEITTRLMELVKDPKELAAVVAHELAHNILHHRARLSQMRAFDPSRARSKSTANLIKATEIEADRLSLYILDRAGYDPSAALILWDRMRDLPRRGSPRTHPAYARRIAIIDREIRQIEAMRKRGSLPSPPADLAPGAHR